MKNRFLPAIVMILIFSAHSVMADTGRWSSRPGYGDRYSAHEGRGGYHGGGYHHHHREWGWTPLAAAAVLGSSFYIANSLANPPATAVYVYPPVVTYNPPRLAYFCPVSQQYYPVVPSCLMPWQVVSY